MEVVFYGNGEAVEGTDELLGLCEVLVPRASSGDGEVEEGFGKTVRQLMCGSCSLAESPGDLFRRPFSTLELLEQLGSGGASNVKLFLREPARLLRKTGDVELGIGRQLVCGDAPFFGNGVEQLLALFGGNFLPGLALLCRR